MAVADYAEGKQVAPPEELSLAFRCQQWNALPVSGGLLDQPAGLVERMTVAVNVYNSWKAWITRDTKKDAHFAKDYPDAWNIVQMVLQLRTHG